MKIRLVVVGKTEQEYLKQGIGEYEQRIRHYVPLEIRVVPALKNIQSLTAREIKSREADALMKNISPGDYVVLLDENGKEMNSVEFSGFLAQRLASGIKSLVFITGGAFGVDESVKKLSNFNLSLSRMTFSHQMVRLFFIEQLYRAMTILRHESYHHE